MRVSVDVGGTFTDVIVLDDAGHLRLEKVETVPANPASGVLSGFQKAEAKPEAIDYFVHGTTLGINALLTRTGAKVAIVTTLGFRDVYDLARTDRIPMYDFTYRKPQSLVPRYLTFEVNERLDFQGNVLTPFDRESALAVAQRLQAAAVDAVAVCFLHAYANPAHELAMAAVLAEQCPALSVTLSHHLSREYREYERTSTTVIDAYVKPITRTYLQKLSGELRRQGLAGQFLMTRSGGGAMTVASAQEQPVHLVLSGPAGGVIGAAFLSDLIGYKNLITIDMGGTSLDASLIVNGKPKIENEQDFQGLPMAIPTIDIHTIGAGGGSMAWIDEGDHLQVGPKSAGASPGPVCYDKGGTQPTFTDAALVIGYLDPANFLGGEITLNMAKTEAALNAMASRLATTRDDVAAGILRISEAKIAGAVREISIEQGHHPRDFAMLAYGGGGAFVAAAVARDLGIPTVIVPPGPANFSAFGMLMVDVVHDFAQTYVTSMVDLDVAQVNQLFATLRAEGEAALAADGFAMDQRTFKPSAELRYVGQEHTVTVPLAVNIFSRDLIDETIKHFNAAHAAQYGHNMDDPVELVTLRLRAIGLLPRPQISQIAVGDGNATQAQIGSRAVYRHQQGARMDYTVYARPRLRAGDQIAGPAIVEEPSSTTILHAGDTLTVGAYGELVIKV